MSTSEPAGHVAVGPRRRLAGGRARRVPRRVLDEQDERPVRMAAGGDVGLRGRDLVERAAEMDRGGAPRPVGGPRDGPVERPVHLEHAGAVAERLVAATRSGPAAGRRRSPPAGVASRRAGPPAPAGSSAQRSDPVVRDDLATGAPSSSADERVRDRLRPPRTIGQPTAWAYVARTRPNDALNGRSRRQHRVGRDAGEQRPRGLAPEPAAGEPARRPERRQPEAGKRQRMPRDVDDRPQELRAQSLPRPRTSGPNSRRQAPSVGVAEARPRWPRTERSRTAARPPSSGWANGASGWTSSTPRAARSIDREERRGDRQRQDRRADVVAEPGERQLRGPASRRRPSRPPRRPGPSARRGPG